MKKSAKPRGAKPAGKKVKDLSAKRGAAKGGYTLFLPDGTPVRASAPASNTRLKEPTSLEFPN